MRGRHLGRYVWCSQEGSAKQQSPSRGHASQRAHVACCLFSGLPWGEGACLQTGPFLRLRALNTMMAKQRTPPRSQLCCVCVSEWESMHVVFLCRRYSLPFVCACPCEVLMFLLVHPCCPRTSCTIWHQAAGSFWSCPTTHSTMLLAVRGPFSPGHADCVRQERVAAMAGASFVLATILAMGRVLIGWCCLLPRKSCRVLGSGVVRRCSLVASGSYVHMALTFIAIRLECSVDDVVVIVHYGQRHGRGRHRLRARVGRCATSQCTEPPTPTA